MKLGQVDLFSKRIRKPRAAPEMALHGMVADTLRISASSGWIWFHVPNGGWRSAAEAGKFKRMGVKAGVSDFLLVAPHGACLHALELKRRGEKMTVEQKAFHTLLIHAGGHAACVDSYEAALIQLKLWGAVSDRVKVSA
jgi:hypothetical protein